MLGRRQWLSAGIAIALAPLTRRADAAPAVLRVDAASNALGAIVAATAGDAAVLAVDRTLGPVELRLGGVVHKLGPAAPRDVLDDPRNAPRLGAGVRKLLAAARPDLAAELERNFRTWTHAFVRQVLAWNARLAASPHRGKRVINSVDRATLFTWAGIVVDPAGTPPPPALARLARDCAEPTLRSYIAYVEALVASLT